MEKQSRVEAETCENYPYKKRKISVQSIAALGLVVIILTEVRLPITKTKRRSIDAAIKCSFYRL